MSSGPFKKYLRLLVHEIRVNKREVQITVSYAALAQAATGNPGEFISVFRFARKRLPGQGSNLLCGLGCQPPPIQIFLVSCICLVATSFYQCVHRMLKAGVVKRRAPLPGPPSIRAAR